MGNTGNRCGEMLQQFMLFVPNNYQDKFVLWTMLREAGKGVLDCIRNIYWKGKFYKAGQAL